MISGTGFGRQRHRRNHTRKHSPSQKNLVESELKQSAKGKKRPDKLKVFPAKFEENETLQKCNHT